MVLVRREEWLCKFGSLGYAAESSGVQKKVEGGDEWRA
jgi:hypothetical protein